MGNTTWRVGLVAVVISVLGGGAWGQCDEGWDDRFGLPDVGFPLHSIVVTEEYGEPVVFGAGYWDGNPSADRLGGLTSWDGLAWSVGAGGLSTRDPYFARFCADEVTGLVYAYGLSFERDGQSLGSLARWDGSAWESLDAPTNIRLFQPGPTGDPDRVVIVRDRPESIAVREGGQWQTIASGIERWDIRSILWADLGNGEQLHVFGRFEEIAGQPIAYAATWDGESWSAFGGGVGGQVSQAVEFDLGWGPGVLLQGGGLGWQFFDGTEWTEVSDEDWPESYWLRGRYTFEGEDVLIFSTGGWGGIDSRLWTWNGNQWRQLPGEFDGMIADVGVYRFDGEPRLYAVGDFVAVDGETRVSLAVFDGRRWGPMGNTDPGGSVREGAVLLDVGDEGGPMLGNKLYVGGALLNGWQDFGSVASWDGVRWESLGLFVTGSSGFVSAMTIADLGEGPRLIVAGGLWDNWGRLLDIGQWDGVEWSSLGGVLEMQFPATALEVFDDGSGPMLYASGIYLVVNGGEWAGVVRFNNGHWERLSSVPSDRVNHMTLFDDGDGETLYICNEGGFDFGDGPIGPVIKWTQGGWVQVGNPLYRSGEIAKARWLMPVEIDGKRMLSVLGSFELEGFGSASSAVLDDGEWRPGSEYFPHRVRKIRSVETAGGLVTLISDYTGDEWVVSMYVGGQWRALPGGFDSWIGDMAWSDVDGSPSVYVAGGFTTIDDLPTDGFARFGCPRCIADFDADGDADAADVTAFLELWSVGDVAADVNEDGYVDTRDVIEFLNVWNVGC